MDNSEILFLVLAFSTFAAFMAGLAYATSVAPGVRIEK